jgi:hypothetical protein
MTYDSKKFDEWFAQQGDDVKALISERFAGLENTVKATRTERDDANSKLGITSKKANFYEEAYVQNCSRPNAAFALALTNNRFDKDGKPDWEAIKQDLPEVFTPAKQNGNTKAGAGTQSIPKTDDWNDSFRKAGKQGTL